MSKDSEVQPSRGSAEYTLRRVTPEDEPFLFGVYAETRAAEMRLVPWTDEQRAAFVRMQFDAQTRHYLNEYPEGEHSVIESGGAAVGRLYMARSERELRILDVTILDEHRGRGIGSAILRDLVVEAEGRRLPLRIYVEPFNPSTALFLRFGFRVVAPDEMNQLLEFSGGAA